MIKRWFTDKKARGSCFPFLGKSFNRLKSQPNEIPKRESGGWRFTTPSTNHKKVNRVFLEFPMKN